MDEISIYKIVVLIYLFILYIIEGYHDYNVWKASSQSQYKYRYTKRWHTFDFIFHIMLGIFISYLIEGFNYNFFHLLINIGILRLLTLNITFNKLRNYNWFYLSSTSNFIDETFKNYEKQFMVLMIIVVVISWSLYIF